MSTIEEKYEKSIELLQKAFEILKLYVASCQNLENEFKELKRGLILSNLTEFSGQLEINSTSCLNESSNAKSCNYSDSIIKEEPMTEDALFSFGIVNVQQDYPNEINNHFDSENSRQEMGLNEVSDDESYGYFDEFITDDPIEKVDCSDQNEEKADTSNAGNEIEGSCTPSSQRNKMRSKAKDYQFCTSYATLEEAQKIITGEAIWAKRNEHHSKGGFYTKKMFYRCKLAKSRGQQCDSALELVLHARDTRVSINRTNCKQIILY